jgi:hypothetical protein
MISPDATMPESGKPLAKALGGHNDVRADPEVPESSEPSGTAVPGLYLVKDQQNAVPIGAFSSTAM